jgi:hypothetical protein
MFSLVKIPKHQMYPTIFGEKMMVRTTIFTGSDMLTLHPSI